MTSPKFAMRKETPMAEIRTEIRGGASLERPVGGAFNDDSQRAVEDDG